MDYCSWGHRESDTTEGLRTAHACSTHELSSPHQATNQNILLCLPEKCLYGHKTNKGKNYKETLIFSTSVLLVDIKKNVNILLLFWFEVSIHSGC